MSKTLAEMTPEEAEKYRRHNHEYYMKNRDRRLARAKEMNAARKARILRRAERLGGIIPPYHQPCEVCKNWKDCSWTKSLTPVKGWKVEKRYITESDGRRSERLKIKKCPNFVAERFDPKRFE